MASSTETERKKYPVQRQIETEQSILNIVKWVENDGLKMMFRIIVRVLVQMKKSLAFYPVQNLSHEMVVKWKGR